MRTLGGLSDQWKNMYPGQYCPGCGSRTVISVEGKKSWIFNFANNEVSGVIVLSNIHDILIPANTNTF